MTAQERWARELAAWAIPEEILRAAPASPWGFPIELFARRADERIAHSTPSEEIAREALPDGGSVLDVGCGVGAGALPLADKAGLLIGVDQSWEMLDLFRARGEAAGARVTTIEGSWPDVAEQTPRADVVLCYHLIYNTPDLAAVARRLNDHARRRVVVESTERHPMSVFDDLWLRFHGLARPSGPTADDAVVVLREAGIEPARIDWEATIIGPFARDADLVAWIRQRLCLPPERDAEIAEAIAPDLRATEGLFSLASRPNVTLWWDVPA